MHSFEILDPKPDRDPKPDLKFYTNPNPSHDIAQRNLLLRATVMQWLLLSFTRT